MAYWLLVLFTGGLFFLVAKILPYVQSIVRFGSSPLRDADRILVKRYDEGTAVYEILRVHHSAAVRWVDYMYYRYLWTPHPVSGESSWVKVKYELQEQSFEKLYASHSAGLSSADATQRLERYGANALDVPVPSYFKLFYTEVIHPFYIFQIASCIIWLTDDYWIYSSCIFVMAVASAIFSVWQARKNREMLAEMCRSEAVVRVLRRDAGTMNFETVSSRDIAPGDLVEVRADTTVPCDLLLIQGQCVVNESALTGESVPVAKVSIPHRESDIFHLDVHGAKHVLYNGTGILQIRPDLPPSLVVPPLHPSSSYPAGASLAATHMNGSAGHLAASADDLSPLLINRASTPVPSNTPINQQPMVLGLAISTGFSTAKGDLIRSILFPRPTRFKFYRDSMRFVGVLFCIALIAFFYTIIIFTKYGSPIASMIHRSLDLITIAVPPALPIAMSIATAFSVRRLKGLSIYCTSPQRINVCGRIDVMCFDKTGTLTEDHLDVYGLLPVYTKHKQAHSSGSNSQSQRALKSSVRFAEFLQDCSKAPQDLLYALAICHSLNTLHGNLIGDPLEIKMFEATGWQLIDSGSVRSPDLLVSSKALKFFEFSSLLQRMSILVEESSTLPSDANASAKYFVYTKGAPEVIKSLCVPSSVPVDFDQQLSKFTQQGKRVLALARKSVHSTRQIAATMARAEAESQLTFLGLFVLQNQLKHDTTQAILNITGGTVANVMVTGDNEYTAINVARQCGILAETDDLPSDAAVYLVTLDYQNDIPMGLKYTYIPGFDPYGPDGESRRHSVIFLHSQDSTDQLLDLAGVDPLDPGFSAGDSSASPSPRYSKDTSSVELSPLSNATSAARLATPAPLIQYSSIDDIQHQNRVFAVHGKAFDYIRTNDRKLYALVLTHGRVYARMTPFDKTHLIEGLQTLGHTVGMCGDGANDVGALKAADVGLSLSDAEASVAAPFTSKVTSIQSMWTLLREGRCALASSIACYKYMAVYSLIQLSTCILLYAIWWDSRLTDPQFLWIDIFLVFPLSFFMGATRPRDELSSRKPPGALVSLAVVGSVVIQTALHLVCQLAFFLYLTKGYLPAHHPEWDLEAGIKFRVSALFLFANFEYVGTCLAYSISKPWRRVFWTNLPFAVSLVVLFLANIGMVLSPPNWLASLLQLRPMENWFKIMLLVAAVLEMVVAWLLERLIVIAWVQPSEERNHKLQPLEHWADDPHIALTL